MLEKKRNDAGTLLLDGGGTKYVVDSGNLSAKSEDYGSIRV